jgi:thymidylate synthase (FAD)
MLAVYPYGDDYGCVAKISTTGDDLTAVHAARVSFLKDFEESDPARDERLLRFMVREGHTSPFEHASVTLRITCPLFVRAHIMRHRTFSFNEVSRRYTAEDIRVFIPDTLRVQSKKNLQCSEADSHVVGETFMLEKLRESLQESVDLYHALIKRGVAREQARLALPQSTYTTFWMTGNLHNWFKFLRLRLDEHTQLETRAIANAALTIIREDFPLTTDIMLKEGALKAHDTSGE